MFMRVHHLESIPKIPSPMNHLQRFVFGTYPHIFGHVEIFEIDGLHNSDMDISVDIFVEKCGKTHFIEEKHEALHSD